MGLRQERLADQIRDVLAMAFMGGQLSDPRLTTVTITAVKLTSDLQLASVYFRTLEGKEGQEDTLRGLKAATGLLRHRIADAVEMRRVPELRFFYDESQEKADRLNKLLDGLT